MDENLLKLKCIVDCIVDLNNQNNNKHHLKDNKKLYITYNFCFGCRMSSFILM